jgi:hypothetical protein
MIMKMILIRMGSLEGLLSQGLEFKEETSDDDTYINLVKGRKVICTGRMLDDASPVSVVEKLEGDVGYLKEIGQDVIDELERRGDFDHWWDDIDEDIKEEIVDALTTSVNEKFGKRKGLWVASDQPVHEQGDVRRHNKNIRDGKIPCDKCDGTGNQLLSMYQKCNECGGTGFE